MQEPTEKVTDRDERLPAEIARRNWIILGVMVLGSLVWRSAAVTLGVLGGGLVAVGGYFWMSRSLRRMMAEPSRRAAIGFQIRYVIRLGALAAALFMLIALVRVNPVALAAGVSVVAINIGWTAIKRSLSH